MIVLKLTEAQLNIIAKALGQMPFDMVAEVVLNVIQPQVKAHNDKLQAAAQQKAEKPEELDEAA